MDAALHFFQTWFDGKKCAFFIDDVWAHGVGRTLVSHLSNIGVNRSSVLITTREQDIASLAPLERIVRMQPRDARGQIARQMLFFHADHEEMNGFTMVTGDSINGILDRCAGLPVSLAAAGKSVKKMSMDLRGVEEDVWKQFLAELEMCHGRLLQESVGSYGNLYTTLATAIRILDQKQREGTLDFSSAMPCSQMHRRLCVLPKQATVPHWMLKHLWQLESDEHASLVARTFVESGLASREAVGVQTGEGYVWHLSLHDSLHDFAVAEAKHNGDTKEAHECLLMGYSSCDPEISCELRGTSRWWSKGLDTDGYLHQNLCRHLLGAGRASEVIALLLSPQWTERQMEVNDFLFLENDFALGITALRDHMMYATDEEQCEVKRMLWLISEALNGGSRDMQRARNTVERQWGAHDDRVTGLALDASGARLLSGSNDGTSKVWDVESDRCVAVFSGHFGPVTDLAVTRNGSRVISVSKDYTAQVWDTDTGRVVPNPFTGHKDSLECVVMLGDGDMAITGGQDKKLRLWDVTSGGQVGDTFDGHEKGLLCAAVTPDGKHIVTGSWDCTVRLWDVGSRKQIGKSLEGHTNFVECVAVREDGRRIVSGSGDNTILSWDLDSGNTVFDRLEGHTQFVAGVSFLAGGDRIVSSSFDGTVRVWDLYRKETKKMARRHESMVSSVSYTPNGKFAVSASYDGTIRVWFTASGQQVGDPFSRQLNWVQDVTVTPNGRYVLSVSCDWTVRIWDFNSRELVNKLTGHTDSIYCIAVTPQGDRVVTGSRVMTLRVWHLWDCSHIVLKGHNAVIERVFVTDDGLRIISVDEEHNVFVWELGTKKLVKQIREEDAWKLSRREVLNLVGEEIVHDDPTLSIPLEGREIVYGEGSYARVLAIVEANIWSWALSPDKKTICLGLEDGQVAFLKLET